MWEGVMLRVQALNDFNIHPSIPVSPFHWFPDGGRKDREPNWWEDSPNPLTCSRIRATQCVCVCV